MWEVLKRIPFVQRMITKKETEKKIEECSEVFYQTYNVTEEHRDILRVFSKTKKDTYAEYIKADMEELIIKVGDHSVSAEYENGELMCYTLYKRKIAVKVLYKDEVKFYLQNRRMKDGSNSTNYSNANITNHNDESDSRQKRTEKNVRGSKEEAERNDR